MPTGSYINSSFLSHFPELVLSRHGDLEQLCQLAGLELEVVTSDNILIPFDRFIALLEVTEHALNLPLVAVELAQRQDMSVLGPLATLLSGCKTFAEVMTKLIDYITMLISGIEIHLRDLGTVVEMRFEVLMPALHFRPQFQNYLLASAALVMHHAVSRQYAFRGVYFSRVEHSDALQGRFTEFFSCPVVFGAESLKITLDKAIMDYPAAAIRENLVRQMNRLIRSPEQLIKQVEQVISLSLAGGHLDLAAVSKALGYSPRSLHRHLQSQGTSFAALRDGIRLSQANQYLTNSHYSLHDIAALLGYSNQSAFTRSYKRWTGKAPIEVRQKN